jgi:O-antigen/teichoic acid export membrane protein
MLREIMEFPTGPSASGERARALRGFSWMLADKAVRLVVGQAVVLVLITRYLGPEQFGRLSYALALSSLGAALGGLGLDEIVVRELVSRPQRRDAVLATAFWLKAIGAAVAAVATVVAAWALRPGEPAVWLLVATVAVGQLFTPWEVAEWNLQAEQRFGRAVLARHAAFLVSAACKIGLIFGGASVWALAAAMALEPVMAGILLAIVWRRSGRWLRPAAAERGLAVALVKESWLLVLSGLLVPITMQADKVLLAALVSDAEAGRYTAAVRLPELGYQVPVLLGVALMPALVRKHQTDRAAFWAVVRKMVGGIGGLAAVAAAVLALGAEQWTTLLYGGRYAGAAPMLAAHATTLVFVSLVSLRSRVLILEGKTGSIAYLAALTAGLGVALNLWAIPRYGGVGAAWVSTATWAFCALLAPALLPQTREMLRDFLGCPRKRTVGAV